MPVTAAVHLLGHNIEYISDEYIGDGVGIWYMPGSKTLEIDVSTKTGFSEVKIPAEHVPDFLVALQAWIEQLPKEATCSNV